MTARFLKKILDLEIFAKRFDIDIDIDIDIDTLIFFSKVALLIFLVFDLKLVLNMTFNLNETYFSEKFVIWRYLTSKLSKIAQIEVFGHFLDFASLVFLDFVHNDR